MMRMLILVFILMSGTAHAGLLGANSVSLLTEAPENSASTADLLKKKCEASSWSSEQVQKCLKLLDNAFFSKEDATYCISISVPFEFPNCLKKIQNKHYSDELLTTCKKVQEVKGNGASECLSYFTETHSYYNSAGIKACLEAHILSLINSKGCLNSIRDRDFDVEEIAKCKDRSFAVLGETFDDCVDRALAKSPLVSEICSSKSKVPAPAAAAKPPTQK